MKAAIISDIHIYSTSDEHFKLFRSFCENPIVLNKVEKVILLGDIFDFFCGDYQQYYHLYQHFFDLVRELIFEGKEVHYFEGNHDFHLCEFFKRNFYSEINTGRFYLHEGEYTVNERGKQYTFLHGDHVYIGDWQYKLYLKIIKSKLAYRTLRKILSFEATNYIGQKESSKSKKRRKSSANKGKSELVVHRNRFRKGIQRFADKKDADFIITGHSHIVDEFPFENRRTKKRVMYLNNGYAPKSRTFLYINGEEYEFVRI